MTEFPRNNVSGRDRTSYEVHVVYVSEKPPFRKTTVPTRGRHVPHDKIAHEEVHEGDVLLVVRTIPEFPRGQRLTSTLRKVIQGRVLLTSSRVLGPKLFL